MEGESLGHQAGPASEGVSGGIQEDLGRSLELSATKVSLVQAAQCSVVVLEESICCRALS